MGKLIFAGILLVAAFLVSRFLKGAARRVAANPRTADQSGSLSFFGNLTFGVGAAIAAFIVLWSTFRIVPVGSVGVVSVLGNLNETPLYSGFNMVNPLAEVTMMTTQIQKHNARYDSSSKDLQKVHVEMTLNYSLVPAKAPEVFKRVGTDYQNVIIDSAAQEVLKAETARHVASEILQQRPTVKDNTHKNLSVWLSKYGIELAEISLADVNFDREYTQAIEAKQVQEQKAEQKRYEILGAQRDAEIRAAKAKGEADAVREEAKGRADALQIEGTAQADYNKKVAESITPMLLQKEYLKKWSGNLPTYMFGDSKVAPVFQIPTEGHK